jgi:ketosteroid isomerase-like protein
MVFMAVILCHNTIPGWAIRFHDRPSRSLRHGIQKRRRLAIEKRHIVRPEALPMGSLLVVESFADCNRRNSVHNRTVRAERVGSAPTENVMEDLHRQRVLNLLESFYAGDIEAAVSHCSDDVDFFSNAPVDILPHLGHRRGKDEIRQMWTSIHSRYSSMRYQVPIVVTEGDKVAVHIRAFFVKRSSERIMQFDIAVFYTFAGGRIVRIREIMDTFDLIQQVLERDLVALLTENPAGNI